MMSDLQLKPLKWTPGPDAGFTVFRRNDGGMHFTFNDLEPETLDIWRQFALDHLLESDRLTRNLYDLQAIDEISEEAIEMAVEANSDPSSRNIRVAVVVADESVRRAVQKIADLTSGGGVEMRIFTDLAEAEQWLSRPISLL
jgi:hypothetical protein